MIEEIQNIKTIIFNKNQNISTQFMKRRKVKDYWKINFEEDIYESLQYFNEAKNNTKVDKDLRIRLNKTFCDLEN